MKKAFEVGDRVVFSTHYSGTVSSHSSSGDESVAAFLESKQECRTLRGTVTAIVGDAVQVKRDMGGYSAAHIRNLRPLKTRKAREWWFHLSDLPALQGKYLQRQPTTNQPQNWVCVREVLLKKAKP